MGNTPQKRVYRIEKYMKLEPMLTAAQSAAVHSGAHSAGSHIPPSIAPSTASLDFKTLERHQEVVDLLKGIQTSLEDFKQNQPSGIEIAETAIKQAVRQSEEAVLGISKQEIEEARRLRAELKEIYDAIEATKKDILTIHQSGVNGMEISRVTDELGAIVEGTAAATENILSAAEQIDQSSGDLAAALVDETQHGLACDIQDQVVRIFEACNFQDLTGQRITKVVSAFRFIEERVIHMMDIWGGVDSFKDVEAEELEHRKGDGALLNGPALQDDDDIASQDDIDALFA